MYFTLRRTPRIALRGGSAISKVIASSKMMKTPSNNMNWPNRPQDEVDEIDVQREYIKAFNKRLLVHQPTNIPIFTEYTGHDISNASLVASQYASPNIYAIIHYLRTNNTFLLHDLAAYIKEYVYTGRFKLGPTGILFFEHASGWRRILLGNMRQPVKSGPFLNMRNAALVTTVHSLCHRCGHIMPDIGALSSSVRPLITLSAME